MKSNKVFQEILNLPQIARINKRLERTILFHRKI